MAIQSITGCLSACLQRTLNIPKREEPDPNWKQISVIRRDFGTPEKREYIEEVRTRDLYLAEEESVIAKKCAMMLLANPVYTAVIAEFHALEAYYKMPGNFEKAAAVASHTFKERFLEGRPLEAVYDSLQDFIWEASCASLRDGWQVVRTAIYGVALEFSAAYGLFKRHEGRKRVAQVEKAWHAPLTYKNDIRYKENKDPTDRIIFLAFCFAVRGNMGDTISDTDPTPKFQEIES